MESVLQDDAPFVSTDSVISQTSSDIQCSSVSEAVRCVTVATATSSKKADSLPLRVSWSPSEKHRVLVCKLIQNGGRFKMCFA